MNRHRAGIAVFVVAVWAGLGGASFAATAQPGSAVWFDLLTENAAVANAFYAEVFGWEIEVYKPDVWLARHNGEAVAGISQIRGELPDQTESRWLVGVLVANADSAVATAKRLGAKVHEAVKDVPGIGRYAVIADPQGAVIMLVDLEEEFTRPTGIDRWVWTELWTDDLAAAGKFYHEVVGYGQSQVDALGGQYNVMTVNDEPTAGLVKIPTESIDPAWAGYIAVEDLDQTMARARKANGKVLVEPNPQFMGGAVALLADPSGAAFFIYQKPDGR